MENNKLESYLQGVAVQQYKSDIGFRTLVESVNDNMYIIPKYQRKYRWKKEQVVSLVESLLRGLPIPPIYTCRNENNQLEILDGQQRVMSLFFYYIGYFLNKNCLYLWNAPQTLSLPLLYDSAYRNNLYIYFHQCLLKFHHTSYLSHGHPL